MKDKFEILNDVKIDVDEYKEIKFDNNDEFKSKMKSTLRNRKSKYKKGLVVASLVAIVGSGILFNENVLAYIEDIWYSVSDIVKMKEDEVSTYKYNINKVAEDKDVKILFRNILLDDGKLLIDVNIDYSKFNLFKGFTKKQQEDWEVEKWGNRDTTLSVAELNEIYIDGVKFVGISGGIGEHEREDENKKVIDAIMEQGINAIENESEESFYEEINKDKFPYVVDGNKTYNFKIKIKKLHLAENYKQYYNSYEDAKKDGGPHAGVIRGNWEVNFDIKGSELIDMSKSYKFNKSTDLNINGKNSKIEIEELKVSPIYMTINCKYYGIDKENIDRLELKILDQENKELPSYGIGYDVDKGEIQFRYKNTSSKYEELTLIPYMVDDEGNTAILFEDDGIKLDINN